MRPLWFTCGATALVLAFIGLLLPVMPTVPFLLLAAICFARSSTRAHKWLLEHDQFGPAIRDWQERGAISRRSKWAATLSMLAAVLISFAVNAPQWLLILQAGTISGVALFIWSRPDA